MRLHSSGKGRFAVLFLFFVSLLVILFAAQIVVKMAGRRARQIAQVAVLGQEKLMWATARGMLSHLSSMEQVKEMKREACESFRADLYSTDGLVAVVAMGSAEGEAVCTADPLVMDPLPTMSDREYYQKVKVAEGLVVGEYVVSKTTGKPVLHFAYPVRGEGGEFVGFVMAGWFADRTADQVFADDGSQVMLVDRVGRVLFAYPQESAPVGSSQVSVRMLNLALSELGQAKLLKGVDGRYRVYAHGGYNDTREVMLYVGVSPFAYMEGLSLILLLLLGLWMVSYKVWKK